MQYGSTVLSDENDRILAAAENEAAPPAADIGLSPGVYFEDLILHHYEEIQSADRLLKAAEDEYYPLQPLSPTEYYDNSLSYESDGDSDLVRFAEEQGDSLLRSRSLSPTLYYETMRSAGVNKPAMGETYERALGPQPQSVQDCASYSQDWRRTKREDQEHPGEHSGDDRVDHHHNGGLSKDLQEHISKPVITTTGQGSSETLVTEHSTTVSSLSSENRDTFSKIVELVIDEKKAFVHEHLLCEVSRFFQRYSRQNTAQTPLSFSVRDYSSDIGSDTLMIFVNWLYFRESYDKVRLSEHPRSWNELLDLYFIAYKWEIVGLKNLLLDVLVEHYDRAMKTDDFPCYCTKKIWSNTSPGASLRRLWVNFYRGGISGTDFRDEMESDALDLDFLKELSVSLLDKEYKNGDSKAKELEDQLAKLQESKLKSEQEKNERIQQLEKSLEETQNLLAASNASKDRNDSIVEANLKAVEEKLQALNKEVESQKNKNENAKKRKADRDWPNSR